MRRKRVLITAGPTREWMDPVRFLSNPSSGSMGLAIADEFRRRGHEVTVVLGPTHLVPSKKIKVKNVQTALQMFSEVKRLLGKFDAFIASAAVGDWRFKRTASSKVKKGAADEISVRLVKNPDILAWSGRFKRKKNLVLIGFALETDRQEVHARRKLLNKNADLIVANGPASFSNADIQPMMVEPDKPVLKFPRMSKAALAKKLADWTEKKWKKTASPLS